MSFSIGTDAGSVFFRGIVPFTQIEEFLSTAKQRCKSVVQDWLGHIDIVNRKLTAIGHQHIHQRSRRSWRPVSLRMPAMIRAIIEASGSASICARPAPPEIV
jgi:hypothetical protein